MQKSVIIVGAGAAGLMASIVLAKKGLQVYLLEKNAKVGKKILATGNGRCNVTNLDLNLSHFHSKNPLFFQPVLEKANLTKTLKLFKSAGIELYHKDNGRFYPQSNQASSISELLELYALELGVKVFTENSVKSLRKTKKGFVALTDKKEFSAHYVLVCTGGMALPNSGSDGDGYNFAKTFGHSLISPFASLIQLNTKESFVKKISGVRIDSSAKLLINKKESQQAHGDILFTSYGLSGPAILDLSRKAHEALLQKHLVSISICLIPSANFTTLFEQLKTKLHHFKKRSFSLILQTIMNKKLIPILLEEAHLKDKSCEAISDKELKNFIHTLLNFTLHIKSAREFQYAETTAGGVNTKEVNAQTMESLKIKGLYFAGEVLDVDGDCGGYNLQWAWSSAQVAAENIALQASKTR